jgi:hypothetical protein
LISPFPKPQAQRRFPGSPLGINRAVDAPREAWKGLERIEMPYRVDYWRHGARGTLTVETFDAALAFAAINEEYGELAAERIVDAAGAVLLEGSGLKDAIAAWIETDDAQT